MMKEIVALIIVVILFAIQALVLLIKLSYMRQDLSIAIAQRDMLAREVDELLASLTPEIKAKLLDQIEAARKMV